MQQLSRFIPTLNREAALWALAGIAAGIVLFGLVRFVFQPNDIIHYHANFAVFINGNRVDFKGPKYYEEIASCSATANPQGRVHMHDNKGDVVHVHDKLVTWANFFSVLGWGLQDTVLSDGKQAYVNDQDGKLQFILNGQPVLSVANEVIKSEDRLLISFGNEDAAALQQQYDQVAKSAGAYNHQKDPAACRGPEELTVWRRLERAFWY